MAKRIYVKEKNTNILKFNLGTKDKMIMFSF